MQVARLALWQSHRLFREGLAGLLAARDDIALVAAVATGEDLLAACRQLRPDVALLEVASGGAAGATRVAALLRRAAGPGTRLIGLYEGQAPRDTAPMRAAGLRLLLPRADGIGPVLRAIRGEPAPQPIVAPSPGAHGARGAGRVAGASYPDLVPLTGREADVLALVGAGRTSRQISLELSISHKTVENHKQRIFGKLGVQNQAHAVVVAMRQGLLEPERVLQLASK